jgi:molecular chaperone GrpE
MAGNQKEANDKEVVEDEKVLAELLDEERQRSEELSKNLEYLQADFENYRKRVDRQINDVEQFATRSLVVKLLGVLDELELAIATAESSGEKSAVLDGIKMTYKNLLSTLENEGLRSIDSVGKPFDPDVHEAVETVKGEESTEKGDVVIEEIRKGFLFRDQVIRPSMVKVKLASVGANEQGEDKGK